MGAAGAPVAEPPPLGAPTLPAGDPPVVFVGRSAGKWTPRPAGWFPPLGRSQGTRAPASWPGSRVARGTRVPPVRSRSELWSLAAQQTVEDFVEPAAPYQLGL